jgi:hypothetical protein
MSILAKIQQLNGDLKAWADWLSAGVITFEKYQSLLKEATAQQRALTEETQATTEAIEAQTKAKTSAAASSFPTRTLTGQAAEDAYNRSINPFGTAPMGWAESAQRATQAMDRFIESLAASGKATEIYRFRAQNEESVAQYAQLIRQAQERLEDAKARGVDAESLRLFQAALENYQETQKTFQRRIDQLDQGVAAAKTASSSGVTHTYEIKFTTASGETRTLTTTQNPEDFLAALEAAQRRSL